MTKGVVLLSGGLDSAVTAWHAHTECEELAAITFNYGQVHKKELLSASKLAEVLGIKNHLVLQLPLDQIGGSSLFEKNDIPIEGVKEGIPSTWVPQRNSLFLTLGFAFAEVIGAKRVYIGANCLDYSGYPDCRPSFMKAMSNALNLASAQFVEYDRKIHIMTPIIEKSKSEIVRMGFSLQVPFKDTWSCYKGEEKACGVCDSCRIRLAAFEEAGRFDPLEYEEGVKYLEGGEGEVIG